MDFDTAKENIQPLASGRNVEHLEIALNAESDQVVQEKLHEQRREFERAIDAYEGDDPLKPWYDYIVWIEQVYPKNGKESALHEILSKCLALFEHDQQYFQDRRMIKLYIKYIDSEANPPQFYEQLYKNGIGTMVADLYVCWAHYYDYCDNFKKAETVYRKGLDARAQPIELLEQAHRQFGFSMSQRILYQDESTQEEFRSQMDEQRLALTSLRAHKHRHIGSIRTGSAVKSHNPGRVDQHVGASSSRQQKENRKVQVYEDDGEAAPTSPTASTSVVQSIINSTKKQENMREPGPWNKAKIKSKPLFSGAACSSKPSFRILEDDKLPSLPIPLPDSENNYARGIQLPKDFERKNLPQTDFSFPSHRDEEPAKNSTYRYDKFMVFPTDNNSYSLEELFAYKWFKKNGIKNNFTRTQDTVWGNGYNVPMRLPPHFIRKSGKQEDWSLPPFNPTDAVADGQRKFGFDINLIYTANGEFSPEEILQSKWLNGDLMSQKEAEMDLTGGFERREDIFNRNAKRRSMILGGRKSILPRKSDSPRKSISARRSIAPKDTLPAAIPENEPTTSNDQEATSTGAIKRTSLPKRKSVYMPKSLESLTTIPETASPPILRRKLNEDDETGETHYQPIPSKFNIFQDNETEESENDDKMFKMPHPVQKSVFQDEDLEGCTTQTFNFFIKSQSISTPKVVKQPAKMADPDSVVSKCLDFGNDSDRSSGEEPCASGHAKQPFVCRGIDTEQPYVFTEPNEIYRQKLSAIMETTEECATVSSLAATASSKSSSVEDFEFTKHTNQPSSVAMSYRQQTIVNNTVKMSSSNLSEINRDNESRKISTIGYDIYQEEPKASEATLPTAQHADVSKQIQRQPDAFDKTLPSTGQFLIYEDEEKTIEAEPKNHTSILAKKNDAVKCSDALVFDISKVETIESNWNHKTLTNNDISSTDQNNEKQANSTSQTKIKSTFQIPREDTGLTMGPINFLEEKTEQMPAFFNGNQTTFTQPIAPMAPPILEAPSIYVPEIPDETTKNMSKIFKANESHIEPLPAIRIDQSAAHNNSVFLLPKEDTVTNVFTANFTENRTENIPQLPNASQMSMVAIANLSVFQTIPEMPTLPEIDFATEAALTNTLTANKTQAMNQTKANPTSHPDKSITNQSVFNSLPEDNNMTLNQSTKPSNKSLIGQKALTESNTSEMSKINVLKPNDKTLSEPPMIKEPIENKSIFNFQDDEKKENQRTENIPIKSFIENKSMNKAKSVDDEIYAMIKNSPSKPSKVEKSWSSPVVDESIFGVKSMVRERMEKSQTAIEAEIYAMVCPPSQVTPEEGKPNSNCNKSILSKSKPSIDDEFYAMIKSPITKKEITMPTAMLIVDTPSPEPPPSKRESMIVSERKTLHGISQLRNPSMSLLEPMKQAPARESLLEIGKKASVREPLLETSKHASVRESLVPDRQNIASCIQRNSSVDMPKTFTFSDDNPNTAMFSLHMPSIKNSTILHSSKDNINVLTEELKTSLVMQKNKTMEDKPKESIEQKHNADMTIEQVFSGGVPAVTNQTSDFKVDSIHIKEERLTIPIKTELPEKPPLQSTIDDEFYDCIKEKDNDINGFLDLSIQLTEAELADIVPNADNPSKPMRDDSPKFLIGNPVSIRPSQFPMNVTKINDTTTVKPDDVQVVEKSFKAIQLSLSKQIGNPDDASLIVVEDTEDLSAVCKSVANQTRRETLHNSFKNRFATNPKLNDTISAVKDEVDPFDMHLQNAFLDDIDFIDYIKGLDYVNITTRVRAIELNTILEMGSETFDIRKQIGQGSFGFVYSGKCTRTGKVYAFKQERPANYWEFYISLEIASRIEDPQMLCCFMSVDYALIGHNSSIFASHLCEYGSLFDICNRHKLSTCRNLDEIIAMIFSQQMLLILDHLHGSNIIHGDIKPDNFLVMKKLTHGGNELVIKLIDYGRSIDLNFFPPNQTFTTTHNTKNFVCTEMLENRPWKQQIDLFCLASTMYTLICGKYMNIKKHDSLIRPYILSEQLSSYLDVPLWEHVLYSLINVRDHNALPDLQTLRLRIREAVADKDDLEVQEKIQKFNAILDS